MGEKSARLATLKANHPNCYFCATGPTETEDHVPSRACFRNRIAPEGFGFPACKPCNNSAGQAEQAVALALILADQDINPPPANQLSKLLVGVKNNSPELFPNVLTGARVARQHFRTKRMMAPPGTVFADTAMFARRLTCALFYKEAGHPVPLDWKIAVAWSPWAAPGTIELAGVANDLFPEYVLSNRRNTNIGDQFQYRWGLHPEGNLFGFSAQFSKSYIIFGAAVAPYLDNGANQWESHRSDIERMNQGQA